MIAELQQMLSKEKRQGFGSQIEELKEENNLRKIFAFMKYRKKEKDEYKQNGIYWNLLFWRVCQK